MLRVMLFRIILIRVLFMRAYSERSFCMNSMTPIIARSVRALLPLPLLLSVTAVQAQTGPPIPPKITYTVTGQGLTGSGNHTYFYQDISFTVFGFYNVSPQIVASGVDNIYGFSNFDI